MNAEHECDVTNLNKVGRATWVCPVCGRDMSLHYLLWTQAQEYREENKEQQDDQ